MAENTEDRHQFSLTHTLEEASRQVEARNVELKRKQELLSDLQATLLKAEGSGEEARLQLRATERAIQSLSQEIIQQQLRAAGLASDSHAVYLENVRLRHKMEEDGDDFQLRLARYNVYRNKMEKHKMAVVRQESQGAARREVVEKRRHVHALQGERERLEIDLQSPEGNTVKGAQKEVDELRGQSSALLELVFNKTQRLAKEQEAHTQLRKDIEIQNKRCEAILRRRRCQLSRAQSSHRRLTDDICWLEKEAADLRRLTVNQGVQEEF